MCFQEISGFVNHSTRPNGNNGIDYGEMLASTVVQEADVVPEFN